MKKPKIILAIILFALIMAIALIAKNRDSFSPPQCSFIRTGTSDELTIGRQEYEKHVVPNFNSNTGVCAGPGFEISLNAWYL